MSAKRKSEKQTHADAFRAGQEQQTLVRRHLCSHLLFWMACGHKKCRRARVCALASNDCFERFWPLVPELLKVSIFAGMEARAEGLSESEVAAAIARARARWHEIQALQVTSSSAPPPVAVAAPVRANPRVRVL